VLAVKYFLLQRDLNVPYSGGLSSFVVACMVRHFLSSIRGNRKSGSNARRKLTDMSPLGPLLLGFLRYFGSRFNFTNLVYFTDGTTRRKSECGLSEGPMFVMANPLENSLVNCAASAFRIAEVATTFAVLEQQVQSFFFRGLLLLFLTMLFSFRMLLLSI
jgi:non-canonical poly(A) RNA polymerase PAPD5/7